MAMAVAVQTVQVFQMVILIKMNVMYVIQMLLMTVLRIVLGNGVEQPQLMSAVYAVVIIVVVLIAQVKLMVVLMKMNVEPVILIQQMIVHRIVLECGAVMQ